MLPLSFPPPRRFPRACLPSLLLFFTTACGGDDILIPPDAGPQDAGVADAAAECLAPHDCPGNENGCQTRTCTDGICGIALAAQGAISAIQTPGDCAVAVCDGKGSMTQARDDTDAPESPLACTHGVCEDGKPGYQNKSFGSPCDDEDPCTQGDTCQLGYCVAGAPLVCNGDATCSGGVCVASECKGTLRFPGAPMTKLAPSETSGEVPSSMAAADFDGDGFSDLVIVAGNRLEFLFGQGDGRFYGPVINQSVSYPEAVTTGDLNQDGAIDVAVTRAGGVTVLFNMGNQLFSNGFSQAAPSGGPSIVAANLNGDLNLDLAYVSGFQVVVFMSLGNGSFAPPLIYPLDVPQGADTLGKSILAVDLNGDSSLDLAVGSHIGSLGPLVAIFLNQGNGTFGAPDKYNIPVSNWPNSLVAMDINADGAQDLLSVTSSETAMLFNKGDGSFLPGATDNWKGFFALAGDVSGLGQPELLTIDNMELHVFLPNGGMWENQGVFFAGKAHSMVLHDFNNDGRLDVAAGLRLVFEQNFVNVLLNDGGVFATPRLTEAGPSYNPHAIAVADLNGDHKADAAISNEDTHDITVLLNQGDGIFGEAWSYAAGQRPQAIKAADLNGDGMPDLAVGNENSNDFTVLINQGNGTFTHLILPYDMGQPVNTLEILDVNEDGLPDLLVPTSRWYAFLNQGNDTFSAPVQVAKSSNYPVSTRALDLNGDTKPDLASAAVSRVLVQLNQGNGSFGDPVVLVQDPGFASYFGSVEAADLNGDALPDLAVTDAWMDAVLVFINQGNGAFGAAVPYAVGRYPSSVAASDLDGDGAMDLVVANRSDASVSTLINAGDGTFWGGGDFAAGWAPASVGVADINDDGRPDIIAAVVGNDSFTRLSVLPSVCMP